MGFDVVNGEVQPRQRFPTLRASLAVVRVPQESPLLNREPSLIVFLLKQSTKDLLEYLGPPLAGSEAVRVALNGKEVISEKPLVWVCAFGFPLLLSHCADPI